MIRLDTYPEAHIATHMNPQNTPPTTPTLCCLLHTGTLPASHHIQVWVGGVQQDAELEGTQQVFSWQCRKDIEMSIHLLQHSRLLKAWRGWWQGETAIAHTGTLVVHVFCAGVPQPAGLTTSPPPVSSSMASADQQNGSHLQAVPATLTWPALLDTSASPLSTTPAGPEDDLWSTTPQASRSSTIETLEKVVAEGDSDQDVLLDDDEESWADEELEEEMNEDDAGLKEEERGEDGREGTEAGEAQDGLKDARVHAETTSPITSFPFLIAPAGTTIATMPANTVWSQAAHQEALDRLTALLSTMPPNTILVDLRQHSPTSRTRRVAAKSGPQKLGLSKELLRTVYGGRYWDRGSVVQTSRCLASAHPLRWRRVVINPDDREGLGALATALAQGFSLVVLDGEISYAASARAAVLSELRQRVANLHEGSCS